MSDSDLIRKISALLAKAESTDNEHEAAAFYAKANELMVRNMIDEQAVREAQGARSAAERPIVVEYMYSTSDSNAIGKGHLMNMAAKASGVKMLDHTNARYSNLGKPGNTGVASQWCSLVGFKDDVEMAKLLYVSLLVQGSRFGHADWKLTGMRKGQSKFMTGYLSGFSSRVGQRLREAREGVAAGSTALIVRHDEEVDQAFREAFPRTKQTHHRVDFAGSVMGRAAGDRADIGQTRVASGARALGAGR